ncbi:MAG TPA: Mu transposase C-terminal domain-containing protein [Candidatus Obscuribacterales bacterium]
MKVLAHDGQGAYEQAFELLHRYEADAPNEMWQADHAQLDILVLDSSGRRAKPWLTVILDDFSRAIAGYYLAMEPPSSMRVALALRQAIWRKDDQSWTVCGVPDKLYSDRGSDFMSRHIDQVAIELKFELLQTLPRKPKGKGKVERFFETVEQLFLTGQPGYSPAGTSHTDAVLALEELDKRFQEWLLQGYQQRQHSETGETPKHRWEANAFLPRLPESKDELDVLLTTVAKPRLVHRDGIRFQGFRYFDVDLAGFVGEEVTVRYDPRDLTHILVYSNDSLVCRAVCFELSGTKVSLKEVIRARNARRREVKEGLNDLLELANKHVPVERPLPETPVESQLPSYPKKKIKRFACDDD